jgi:uroporphyrinogen decarboxylase
MMELPREWFVLRDRVHEFNLKTIEAWCKTDLDALSFNDDWGAQHAMLIAPDLWRELFKPLYREYVEAVHAAGKFLFMHSDGHIFAILEDLIEIGVDALNSQLFCMDIEEIGRRYKGQITFWGEIDRQWVLPADDPQAARDAVRRVHAALYDPRGGVIAQCQFGPAARPENVTAVYETWEQLTGGR